MRSRFFSYLLTMSQKNTHKGCRCETNPQRSLAAGNFLSSVCGPELTSHCTDLPKHPAEHEHTQREREYMNLASNPTHRCVKVTVCPNAYQVKLLYRLAHAPFLTAGACGWRKKKIGGQKVEIGNLLHNMIEDKFGVAVSFQFLC